MNALLLSFLSDFFKILVAQKDFFEKSSSERRKSLPQKNFLPETLETYIVAVSAEQFEQDLKNLVRYFHTPQAPTNSSLFQGTIFEALAEFFIQEFASFLDHGKATVAYQGAFGKTLTDFLTQNSFQEITADIAQFLHFTQETATIVIQAAREIDPELKTEIRRALRSKYSYSFPAFSVRKNLMGGFRLFINGVTQDYSWLSSINHLASL